MQVPNSLKNTFSPAYIHIWSMLHLGIFLKVEWRTISFYLEARQEVGHSSDPTLNPLSIKRNFETKLQMNPIKFNYQLFNKFIRIEIFLSERKYIQSEIRTQNFWLQLTVFFQFNSGRQPRCNVFQGKYLLPSVLIWKKKKSQIRRNLTYELFWTLNFNPKGAGLRSQIRPFSPQMEKLLISLKIEYSSIISCSLICHVFCVAISNNDANTISY